MPSSSRFESIPKQSKSGWSFSNGRNRVERTKTKAWDSDHNRSEALLAEHRDWLQKFANQKHIIN